jgi:hypothetical protein
MGVWSYYFVEAQTHDGRKLRLMTLIDEFTRSPPFWSVGKSHDSMPQRPRSADRTRSPATVSGKREFFKCPPETIGNFAERLHRI